MKILIAPDSFKGTLSSVEVCDIIGGVLKEKYPEAEIVKIPIADGGEGTSDAYYHIFGGEMITVKAESPLGNGIDATYALLKDKTAVIETAAASGISIEKENDALRTSTYGTGQLVLEALNKGAERIILGLGGSATTDGGMGFLSALGVRFLKADGSVISKGADDLAHIEAIDLSALDKRLQSTPLTVLCDVKNPLTGETGAAFVFAPQKGADKEQVKLLDNGLRKLAEVTAETLGKDFSSLPGAGAAGGMGFAAAAFLGAKLQSGIDCILDAAKFETLSENADLVITGEGKMDSQSLFGKAPFGVAKRSKAKKTIAVVGLFEADADEAKRLSIEEVIETNPLHLPFDEIKDMAEEMLAEAAKKITV
ncbi:MAG: glycerate kinase [Acutalibacteraceae bacterium]